MIVPNYKLKLRRKEKKVPKDCVVSVRYGKNMIHVSMTNSLFPSPSKAARNNEVSLGADLYHLA